MAFLLKWPIIAYLRPFWITRPPAVGLLLLASEARFVASMVLVRALDQVKLELANIPLLYAIERDHEETQKWHNCLIEISRYLIFQSKCSNGPFDKFQILINQLFSIKGSKCAGTDFDDI